MTIIMNDSHLMSIAHVKEFLKISKDITFKGSSRKEKYAWIATVLSRFRYRTLLKKEKSVIKQYVMRMTGLSDAQVTRLIARKQKTGDIVPSTKKRHRFSCRYTSDDMTALIETDNAHDRLSGPATKRIFQRTYAVFGNLTFERLKDISVSHIYNLRGRKTYQTEARTFTKTHATKVLIGQRKKPRTNGEPGFLRVDTVHQGDKDKEKGVYHINVVDEVTQWEIVGAVEKISERFLLPLLEDLIAQFPFKIKGFHSDNGSEYINKTVAELLGKLLIAQTKSRSRHCNDNALVEGKNGSVIRKAFGYFHIPQRFAQPINVFYTTHLNVYLNYHRPCGFATSTINEKGKEKKIYDTYQTPYERFRMIPNASHYLREDVTNEQLETIAKAQSDNDCGKEVQKEKKVLFDLILKQSQTPHLSAKTIINGKPSEARTPWKPAEDHPWRKRFLVKAPQPYHESSRVDNSAYNESESFIFFKNLHTMKKNKTKKVKEHIYDASEKIPVVSDGEDSDALTQLIHR